jgi:hypothetical protein
MVGWHGEGDEADRRAPHGGDVRKRRRLCRSVQGQREYAFQKIRQCRDWLVEGECVAEAG